MTNPHHEYARVKNSTALSGIGQVLNTLSEANSKALLSEHSNLTHSRRDEAAAILSRLQELNPTIASQFGAKQDAISSLVLRMLSTQEPASGSFSSFIAVSYCWHYAEHWPLAPAATPIAPGWEISQPMVDAVMGLRVNADEGVWLDKLCINQNDETDKILHIGAMDTVYRSARRIVILLEDIQLDREEETAALAYSAMYADMVKQVKEQELEGQAKADFIFQFLPREEAKYREERRDDVLAGGKAFAKKLLAARWFSRAWCAHESRVAHHHRIKDSERIPLFLCYGHDGSVLSFEFRFMFFLAMHLSDSEPEVNLVGTAYMDALNDPNPTSLRQLWWRIQRLLPDNAQVSAMQHLVSIVSFGCFNKGDLISIALNTAQIPLFFRGDVEFEDDVLWIFSVLMLAAGDVVPLVLHGVKLRMVDADGKKTISWMSRPFQGALDDSLPIAAQNTITSVTREYIELDLLLFTSLPATASAESLEVAAKLIAEHQLETLAEIIAAGSTGTVQNNIQLMTGEVNRVRGARQGGPMSMFLQLWIALAIDCGIDWLLRFPDNMKEGTEGTWQHETLGDKADPRLADAARSLLAHFNRDTTPTADSLDKATKFLTCVLDPRLKFYTITPRAIPAGPGDFAITTSQSNRTWIAIPAAIAHLPSWYKRAWAIEPFDPAAAPEDPKDHLPDPARVLAADDNTRAEDVYPLLSSDYPDRRAARDDERGTWRLRNRQEIFGGLSWGDPGILKEGPGGGVVLLKRQRVYGAEDYDWRAITEVVRRAQEEAAAAAEVAVSEVEVAETELAVLAITEGAVSEIAVTKPEVTTAPAA